MPSRPRPIVIIGAGGVVRGAHLPAYHDAGFEIAGLFDVDRAASDETARQFGVARVFPSLKDAMATRDVVFDVAVPADQILTVLGDIPSGSTVLLQKPMGRDLAEAKSILETCRTRALVAAVNFQLRFAPNMLALGDAIGRGDLGEITDVEIRVITLTPWSQWQFLAGIPRLEVLYHSIHYLDLVRSFFGEPRGVHGVAMTDPSVEGFADARSTTILVYDEQLRCVVHTNHSHAFDRRHRASQVIVQGTRGAAIATMGVNLDYPRGEPDALEIAERGGAWREIPLRGSWFPQAFAGTMANLQRFAVGEDAVLHTRVDDAVKTMALVEACYASAGRHGAAIPFGDASPTDRGY
ncbi:MAG: Gfo/Idh/MocA family oxidoreductase [Planctomycetes bacterium]|nr:Gfo/Idh/MocA family oxidoreductase [Planctomycetota bacterium]